MKKIVIIFGAVTIGAMFFLKFVGTHFILAGTKKMNQRMMIRSLSHGSNKTEPRCYKQPGLKFL